MKNEKLGSEPAFPPTREMQELAPTCEGYHVGMSKRFYAACAAMQGILSGELKTLRSKESGDGAYPMSLRYNFDKKKLIKNAYELADELLTQENE